MSVKDKIIINIYNIATSIGLRRVILAPIIGSLFALLTAMFVIIPVNIESRLDVPAIIISPLNLIAGVPLILTGTILVLWSSWYFIVGKRTPVPVNPPVRLIIKGPYAYSRNPMHTGLFILMFGFGFYYHSVLSIIVFTPIYILMDVWMIINIEEPELEKRLGNNYIEYKKRVNRFIPWKSSKRRDLTIN